LPACSSSLLSVVTWYPMCPLRRRKFAVLPSGGLLRWGWWGWWIVDFLGQIIIVSRFISKTVNDLFADDVCHVESQVVEQRVGVPEFLMNVCEKHLELRSHLVNSVQYNHLRISDRIILCFDMIRYPMSTICCSKVCPPVLTILAGLNHAEGYINGLRDLVFHPLNVSFFPHSTIGGLYSRRGGKRWGSANGYILALDPLLFFVYWISTGHILPPIPVGWANVELLSW